MNTTINLHLPIDIVRSNPTVSVVLQDRISSELEQALHTIDGARGSASFTALIPGAHIHDLRTLAQAAGNDVDRLTLTGGPLNADVRGDLLGHVRDFIPEATAAEVISVASRYNIPVYPVGDTFAAWVDTTVKVTT